MLKTLLMIGLSAALLSLSPISSAGLYGQQLCGKPGYHCIKIKRGNSWKTLWPDESDQNIVRRLNRMNTPLRVGMTIAVPDNLWRTDLMDISPFPYRTEPTGQKMILIVLSLHAFAAYDQYGYLQYWGPVSAGKGYCPDVGRRCGTVRGTFRMYTKQGPGCISSKYPVPYGGSKMPYCMFFYGGFAMHGGVLPGYHASHGCVRLFPNDARWLNQNFIDIGRYGTQVIIQS